MSGIFLVLFATLCKAYTNIWAEELIIGYINRPFYLFFKLWRSNKLWDHVLIPNSFSFYFLSVLCCMHTNLLKCKTCSAVQLTCGLSLLSISFKNCVCCCTFSFMFVLKQILWIKNKKNFAVLWLLCRISRRWSDVCIQPW